METQIVPNPEAGFQFPSSYQLLKESWQIYKKHFKNLIYITLIPAAVLLAGIIIALILQSSLSTDKSYAYITLAIPFGLFIAYLTIWSFAASLRYIIATNSSPISIHDAFKTASHDIFPLFITGLWVTVSILGGLILLVIPGIIFAFWFSQSYYVVITQGIYGKEALTKSKFYVKGNIWELFKKGLYITLIGMALSIVIAIILIPIHNMEYNNTVQDIVEGVARLLFSPLAAIYSYRLFLTLKNSKNA